MGRIVKWWAIASMVAVCSVILFLFIYVFVNGASVISWEFLTAAPQGAVLGSSGGIFPAIIGSLWFTAVAVVIGGIPAIACALFVVFYCKSAKVVRIIHTIIQCISGIPSIVLGLFAYSFFVRDLDWGRCILSSGIALAIMVMPFIETRAEKAFRELPKNLIMSAEALGVTKTHCIFTIVLPATIGELASGLILGACFAMGATAPLIFTGGVAFASLPSSVMDPAMALPLHLYLLTAQGAPSFDIAYGTALVMMAIIMISNLAVTVYSQRSQRKWNN